MKEVLEDLERMAKFYQNSEKEYSQKEVEEVKDLMFKLWHIVEQI